MKTPFKSKIHRPDKLYGTVTVGARGQVVIPSQARRDLKIKPGDRLLVTGKHGKVLSMFKAEQMGELLSLIMESAAGTPYEKEIRARLGKFYGNFKKKPLNQN